MPKKITQQEFINRCKTIHGDKYDYSGTSYVDMRHKIDVICPVHGLFSQLPQAHLKGQGCPVCGQLKYLQTLIDRYGVDNPMKVLSIQNKARRTCMEKYGHKWAMSCDSVKEKVTCTNQILYGADRPLQNDVIMQNMLATVQKKYGVSNVMQVDEFKQNHDKVCLEHFGVSEPLASDAVRGKIKDTNMEKYGGSAPMSSDKVREKFRTTCMDRYAVPHPSKLQSVVDKINLSKSLNGSYGKSGSEDLMYQCLCDLFGEDDVFRQHSSEIYPFLCDFYIASRNLYIEFNALWTHGSHWFDENDVADIEQLRIWREKALDSKYYKNAVLVWTKSDPNKRMFAQKNGLNYLVFWDNTLNDFHEWVNFGCPDGRDWDKMYSWK